MHLKSKLALSALFLASGLLLSGCTINVNTGSDHDHMGMMHEDSSSFSSADIMFAQMMIEHHQQAVDMGTLAETRASSAEVKELAAKIKAEQAPEIEQMKAWLKAANASQAMGHDMHMDGMLTDEQMTQLSNSSGADFDRLYLQGMVQHHEGAILMAKMVISSNNSEVKKLAENIVSSQTEQISYMQGLLAK